MLAAGCTGTTGVGTRDDEIAPPSGLGRYREVATGASHGCELGRGGGVWCQGLNLAGQLGDGTTTSRSVPVPVAGLANQVSVAAGSLHSCAIGADGGMRCWGSNTYGQLGTGTTTASSTPQAVNASFFGVRPLTGVVAASGGYLHTCAVDSRGYVWCWGLNGTGQLGDGTTTSHSYATPVALNASAVAAGAYHTCALLADHTVQCWGHNGWGQLGDGAATSRSVPGTVPGLSGVVALEAGYFHTCALLADGTVRCWGYNGDGEMGSGTAASVQPTPVPVRNGGGVDDMRGVRAVGAGAYHACAVLASGATYCWGRNSQGQLGDGTTATPQRLPVRVGGLVGVSAVHVAGGAEYTCAKLADGALWCWGANEQGQLGDGSTTGSPAPRHNLVPQWISSGQRLAVGTRYACALASDHGRVWCWGDDWHGQLGDGHFVDLWSPTVVPGLEGVTQLALGRSTTCALQGSGSVLCWGDDGAGQVGNAGVSYETRYPTVVTGVTNATAVTVGADHACALLVDGTARCWGANGRGQLGDRTTTNRTTAVPVLGLTNATALAAGGESTCALIADGTVRCWGGNQRGALGDGTTSDRPAPTAVIGITGAAALSIAGGHGCVVLRDGTARCWGVNTEGQVGDGTTRDAPAPVAPVGLTNAIGVATSSFHTCALLDDGGLRCWGAGDFGEIGDGATADRHVPTPVVGIGNVLQVAAGDDATCAARADGTVWCWGDNGTGQIGNGTRTPERNPTPQLSWAQP